MLESKDWTFKSSKQARLFKPVCLLTASRLISIAVVYRFIYQVPSNWISPLLQSWSSSYGLEQKFATL